MVEVFFCIDTWSQVFFYTWWCERCSDKVKVKRLGIGFKYDFPSCPDSVLSPVRCDRCGHTSTHGVRHGETIWKRLDTGEEFCDITQYPGACYNELNGIYDPISHRMLFGPDGRALRIVCPNGRLWSIDGRAPDCGMIHDHRHKCWIRQGSPDDKTLSVELGGPCRGGDPSFIVGDYWGSLIGNTLRAY